MRQNIILTILIFATTTTALYTQTNTSGFELEKAIYNIKVKSVFAVPFPAFGGSRNDEHSLGTLCRWSQLQNFSFAKAAQESLTLTLFG